MSLAVVVWALGWALIHSLWQGLGVGALVRVGLALTRDPGRRHALAFWGSTSLGVAFVLTFRIQLIELSLTADRAGQLARAQLLEAGAGAPGLGPVELALPWLVLAWLCGVGWFAARAGLGHLGLARLRASAVSIDGRVERRCAQLGEALGIDRAVAIAESALVEVPLVLGWLRPLVLLPLGLATRMSPDELEAAIAHELAHVRRNDFLHNAILVAVEAALFHHPCVWWLGRVARRERELACDDLVIAHATDRLTYARALLTLERERPGPAPAMSMAAHGAPLRERIRRLIQTKEEPMSQPHHEPTTTPLRPRRSMAVWAPLVALGLGIAAAVTIPACLDAGETDPSSLEVGQVEGTISIGDEQARVDIPWLPEPVAAHAPEIEAAARRHGVDPNLLAIVVLLESGGNPRAQSPTGARGLMQIMPATARSVARERAMAQPLDLWDPATNLDLGAWYLSRQLADWGEVELAAAAYNGGPDAVFEWLVGAAALGEETRRYKAAVTTLWAERHAERAPQL